MFVLDDGRGIVEESGKIHDGSGKVSEFSK